MTTDWYATDGLPRYASPPVVETAMALEFPALQGMDTVKLVHLQEAWRESYPELSEAPGSPPTPVDASPTMLFQIGDGPRRVWAAQPETGYLIQTQADRLILNWRKHFSPSPYPGYDPLRAEFSVLWEKFISFASAAGLGIPVPHLAEFTYVNAVPLLEGDTMSSVVELVASPPSGLPGTDSFGAFQFVREVNATESNRLPAQIHLQGQPQQGPEGRVLMFTVTTRVLLGAQSKNPLPGLDSAHALSSRTFSSVVTATKQIEWGRLN